MLFACTGSPGTAVTQDLASEEVGQDILQKADVTVEPDTVLDLGTDLKPLPDFKTEDVAVEQFSQCAPGEGCLGDPCSENADCLSGWCVEHLGDGVCSSFCQEECPAGWACKAVGSGPDVVSICVSDYANLCKPCLAAADCISPAGEDNACISYGDQGAFCGGLCQTAEDCPWGFSCIEADTVDGVKLTQCVADAGVCPCTDKSAALGLWTPCSVENQFGICTGKRVCTQEGLSACDAGVPVVEQCNGADDDCDGMTDEPLEVDGDFVNLCDDDNECTQDKCLGEEGCQQLSLTEGECKDGDACTVGDHCEEGECVGLPILCDDDNPCTDDMCDGLGGCTAAFNHVDCDDADPCTVGDVCKEGLCQGFAVACDCQSDADCLALEDGDKCNGTLYCDVTAPPFLCKVVSDTLVSCPDPDGPDSICKKSVCEPETGECLVAPDHEGFACDDADLCTVGDKCVLGACVPGVPVACNDGNLCTDDSCQPETGCTFEPNQEPCNDGDTCTTTDNCSGGACVGAGELECDDGNLCTDDLCQPAVGCVHSYNLAPCDDDNQCTTGDQCSGGKCQSSGILECEDGNPCTINSCLPAQGCAVQNADIACNDGDPCTLNDHCVEGLCVSGVAQQCDDGNVCTSDSCLADGSCLHEPLAGDCNDGNQCTAQDECVDGECKGITPLDCDDGNLCTTDGCSPAQGCVHTLNSNPCDDGDLCTTGDHCHLGECISSDTLACNDNNDCTDDSCLPQAGCTFAPNTDPCDDGSVCTQGDACANGWCKPGQYKDCNDGKLCTDDSCDPEQGCLNVDNNALCDDGDECTVGDICQDGVCIAGAPANCNDENQCTADSCDPLLGCLNLPLEAGCDDGDLCTEGDLCVDSACVIG